MLSGTYTVNVLDANNCPGTVDVVINDLAGPTATAGLVSDASGAGLCDGEVTVTSTGGTTPYTYLWDDPAGQTTQNATGLCAGTYCVTVTDANGCTSTSCVTVNEPGAIVITIDGTDLLCNGVCIGAADATISGGVTPYTFSWDNGATTEDLSNLCAGTYTLTVTDANSISNNASITISEPTAVTLTQFPEQMYNVTAIATEPLQQWQQADQDPSLILGTMDYLMEQIKLEYVTVHIM